MLPSAIPKLRSLSFMELCIINASWREATLDQFSEGLNEATSASPCVLHHHDGFAPQQLLGHTTLPCRASDRFRNSTSASLKLECRFIFTLVYSASC